MKFRAGDRVEITLKDGRTLYGTVHKGGRTVCAVIDGNQTLIKAPASAFRPTDKPLPVSPPSPMDRWGLRKYQSIPGHGDSPTFHAEITLDGRKVGEVRNSGDGGPDSHYFSNHDLYEQFLADARKWAEQFGYADMLEPESAWVDWYVHARPFGQTADVYVRQIKAEIDRMLGKEKSPGA